MVESASNNEKLDEIQVKVEGFRYQNPENGFAILLCIHEKEKIIVKGIFPGVIPMETLMIKGQWVEHPKFGLQMDAKQFERVVPETKDEVISYLSSGVIEGISKGLAKKIVDTFGDDVFDIMEKTPEKLAEIKGISKTSAKKMSESYVKQMGTQKLMTFLTRNEIPVEFGAILTKYYGDMAQTVVEKNPYLMVSEDFGLEFFKADSLAQQLGLPPVNENRIHAGVLFAMRRTWQDGHCFLPENLLIEQSIRILGCTVDLVKEALVKLVESSDLVQVDLKQGSVYYLYSMNEAEEEITIRLLEMCQHELLPPDNLDELIDEFQENQKITYSPQQKEAVETAAKHQVMILTGGPGTGKTTSLKGVLALFDALDLETCLTAPTGRASQRLGDLCDGESSTIHRLLDSTVDPNTGKLVFQKDVDDPLSAKAVIVDETSMVDVTLMAALLSALANDCRLILVGDPDQLPSVGPGNLFADMIYSGVIPKVRLSQIFRQAEESNIVRNAHLVNQGILPSLNETKGDFFFIERGTAEDTLETIVDMCVRRLPQKGYAPEDIQVLTPTRKATTGTMSLNVALQAALNPPNKNKGERQYGSWTFRTGDKVMQVKNNYEISWKEVDGEKSGKGVFNGDIGYVEDITTTQVVVIFDGRKVAYSMNQLMQLEPAYAITVHKAQGSEYPAVVFAAFDGSPLLFSRGIFYTGITRAKKIFVAVGSPYVIGQMVRNERKSSRFSGLEERLLGDDDY